MTLLEAKLPPVAGWKAMPLKAPNSILHLFTWASVQLAMQRQRTIDPRLSASSAKAAPGLQHCPHRPQNPARRAVPGEGIPVGKGGIRPAFILSPGVPAYPALTKMQGPPGVCSKNIEPGAGAIGELHGEKKNLDGKTFMMVPAGGQRGSFDHAGKY